MELFHRHIEPQLQQLARWYPVVSITGPRQSGKSTLAHMAFPDYHYINLEDPATRKRANADPSGFIRNLPYPAIIDEAQYAPELFSAIQAASDARPEKGQYVLSGSQNFLLLKHIQQSLAGRVGIAHVLPLAFQENPQKNTLAINDIIVRGSYPHLYTDDIPPHIFYRNYIDTYITRDVRDYLDVRDTKKFRAFLTACALRTGKLINYTDLSRDIGVSVPTTHSWLSILEASFITVRLQPYSRNIGKRLTKTPKLFFYDTGLACHLLGIQTPNELFNSEHYGSIFENYIIAEQLKTHTISLREPRLYFYRDDSKKEIDLIDASTKPIQALEIKSGETFRTQFTRTVKQAPQLLREDTATPCIVYGGTGEFSAESCHIYGAREWLEHQNGNTRN